MAVLAENSIPKTMNGYEIIDRYIVNDEAILFGCAIVSAHDGIGQFVTARVNANSLHYGEWFAGHYFGAYDTAYTDYKLRINENLSALAWQKVKVYGLAKG